MNILFVSTDYPERGKPTTGFPNYLYRVSLALVQMGHKPVILAAGNRDGHRIEQGIDIYTVRLEYIDCKSRTLRYVVNALRKGYILNQKLNGLMEKMAIDVVQFTSLEGIAIFYRGNTPAVLRLSSYAKTSFASYQTYDRKMVWAMSFMERLSAARCSMVFAPCRNTAEAVGKDCGRAVKVVESPFVDDVQEYDYSYSDKLKGRKYALFFGTLYAEKGILVIAEVLERFLRENPHHYFLFIGNVTKIHGESAARILEKKAGSCRDRVVVWSAMSHKQLYPVIMGADFVVLPSYMENLSNACIEAMHFGRVVIGTDGASFEQLITHGKNGLLCRIGDSRDLFEKMQMAASMDEKQKQEMGEQASAWVDRLRSEYTVEKLVRLYEYLATHQKN